MFFLKGFQLFAADWDTGSESPEASGNEKVCRGPHEGSGNTKRKPAALLGNPFGAKYMVVISISDLIDSIDKIYKRLQER